MYILMVGNPYTGFALVGPYASEEAASDAEGWARIKYGYGDGSWNDWWVFELNALGDIDEKDKDPAGTAVVFAGSIVGDPSIRTGWGFYGPFTDLEAARRWAYEDGLGSDCAVELQPVKELEAA